MDAYNQNAQKAVSTVISGRLPAGNLLILH